MNDKKTDWFLLRSDTMKILIGLLTVICGFFVGVYLLPSCNRAAQKTSPAEKLILISPHYEGIRKEYESAFNVYRKSQHAGEVEFEWLDQGGTSDDLRFVKSEFSRTPAGINIDLFWGGGIDPYQTLKKMNLLQQCALPEDQVKSLGKEVGGIPVYDPEGYWYGGALSGFGIMYNKPVLQSHRIPEPKTWEDLAKPQYYNWVSSTDPRHSGSAHMMCEIMLQALGWERGFDVLGRIAGNSRTFTDSASQIPKDVAQGEAAAAPVIDFYAWSEAQNVGDKVGFVYPEGLTVINPDGIALLKGAPHRELAQEFVSFVLSETGQKLLMLPKGASDGPREFTLRRMAVLPGLYASLQGRSLATINPFEWKAKFTYDSQKGSQRWDILDDLLGATMIDPLTELRAAVKKRGGSQAPIVVPPISETTALQLAQSKWKDAAFRNKTLSQWTSQARARYR